MLELDSGYRTHGACQNTVRPACVPMHRGVSSCPGGPGAPKPFCQPSLPISYGHIYIIGLQRREKPSEEIPQLGVISAIYLGYIQLNRFVSVPCFLGPDAYQPEGLALLPKIEHACATLDPETWITILELHNATLLCNNVLSEPCYIDDDNGCNGRTRIDRGACLYVHLSGITVASALHPRLLSPMRAHDLI